MQITPGLKTQEKPKTTQSHCHFAICHCEYFHLALLVMADVLMYVTVICGWPVVVVCTSIIQLCRIGATAVQRHFSII